MGGPKGYRVGAGRRGAPHAGKEERFSCGRSACARASHQMGRKWDSDGPRKSNPLSLASASLFSTRCTTQTISMPAEHLLHVADIIMSMTRPRRKMADTSCHDYDDQPSSQPPASAIAQT